ncbi:MAG: MucB/RseB C-terminal domain-containing protein [Gammaproteobacteria bacterium]|nr:MucB/RseB C-terminal domain-containing protein [Gammaproteobacteria bacterium]
MGGICPEGFRRLLLVTILATLTPQVSGETDPASWLVRVDIAVERANFSGTMSLVADGETRRTMKIEQGFDGRNTHQRLVSVSGGEECEILRRGDESAVVYPDRRVVIHGYRRSRIPIPKIHHDLDRLKQHYRLELRGQEKVAGRDCQLVMAESKDGYRYGCELCVDMASGLPLRVRMMMPGGEKIEHFTFTSLDVRESIQEFHPNSFWLTTDTQGFETVALPSGAEPVPHTWEIKNLPPGFEQQFAVIRKLPLNPEPIYHLVLADALSRISVFITHPPEGTPEKSWHFSRKALNGYVTIRDGHHVAVIGGVPAETVRMIGDSLHLQQ